MLHQDIYDKREVLLKMAAVVGPNGAKLYRYKEILEANGIASSKNNCTALSNLCVLNGIRRTVPFSHSKKRSPAAAPAIEQEAINLFAEVDKQQLFLEKWEQIGKEIFNLLSR